METKVQSQEEIHPTLRDPLEKIAKYENFNTFDIKVKKIDTEGASYSGDLFAIDITGKTDKGEKEINLFVKRLVEAAEENMKDMAQMSEGYAREAFFYTTLSKIFTDLQDEAKIPEDDRLKMVKGYAESSDRALFLQNVSKLGFKTGYRMDLISYEFAKLSLENLARFHAFSFVMEKKQPSFYEKQIKPKTPPMEFNEGWINTLTNLMGSNASNLKNIELKKKAENFVPIAVQKFLRNYVVDRTPVELLCHGDYRMNNILMKETDGKVTEVIGVDYQTMHYGCPIHDIVYLIYTGTDRKFREEYLTELIDIYYNTMERFLRYFDMDIRDCWPRNVFDKMYEERRDMGLCSVFMVMGFLLVLDESIIDFSNQKMADWKPSVHDSFEERFGDIVTEFLG